MLSKHISAFLLAVILALTAYSQTTQEEYNYITKGYKVQVESGLDMKKGYELVDVTSANAASSNPSENRTAWLKALYRIGSARKLAAYMVIYQKGAGEKEYLCVPHIYSEKAMIQSYYDALYNASDNSNQSYRLQLICLLLSKGLKWYE